MLLILDFSVVVSLLSLQVISSQTTFLRFGVWPRPWKSAWSASTRGSCPWSKLRSGEWRSQGLDEKGLNMAWTNSWKSNIYALEDLKTNKIKTNLRFSQCTGSTSKTLPVNKMYGCSVSVNNMGGLYHDTFIDKHSSNVLHTRLSLIKRSDNTDSLFIICYRYIVFSVKLFYHLRC